MEAVSKVKRFVAYFIDALVGYIPLIILGMINQKLAMVGYLPFLAYILLRDALFGGQSLGKKVMGYKAVTEDGSSLEGNYQASVIRNISLMIPFVDPIFVLMGKDRLGDGWAKTKVVGA